MNLKTQKKFQKAGAIFLCSLIGSAAISNVACAQTPAQIDDVISKSKLLPPEYKTRASISGPEVLITTYRNAAAHDPDLKIDAILIGRKVMEAFPSVAAVRTQFYHLDDPKFYDQVEVHIGDVKAFEAGGVSKQKLLDSLPIAKTSGKKNELSKAQYTTKLLAYSVAPGFEQSTRQSMLSMLRAIDKNAGDGRTLWDEFMVVEDKIRANPKIELTNEINILNGHISKYNETAATYIAKVRMRQADEQTQIKVQNAARDLQAHYGPLFEERTRIAKQLSIRVAAGQTAAMKIPIATFINVIEPMAVKNDPRLPGEVQRMNTVLNLGPLPTH